MMPVRYSHLPSVLASLLAGAGAWAADNPGKPVPAFELQPAALGNVFVTPQRARLPLVTRGDRVKWAATDFWHRPVASGDTPVRDTRAVITLPAALTGYFLVHLVAEKEGKPVAERYTSFAVIPPHQVTDKAESPFGVMTHFAQGMDPEVLPLFTRAGIVSIRDEHYWGDVEKAPGQYVFAEQDDRYMAACKAAGIDPLIAMTFGNKLYDHKDGPSTPQGYAGYGRYGQALLNQYGEQIRWLEIWNEYNGSWCPPQARADRPKYYAEMLKAAYTHIKAVRPEVQVLGCACVLIPLPYIEGIFKHGGLVHMDGIVIHPYRDQPEGVDIELDELQALIRTYNNGKDKPVWVTETGRYGKQEFDWEQGLGLYERGRQEGARYLPRMLTLLLSRRVAKIYWYLGCDYKDFVTMGLLRTPDDPMGRYAVAPAYVTYAALIRQLGGAAFVRREAARDYTRARVYLFQRGAEQIRVCWATQPARLRVRTAVPLKRVTLVGAVSTVVPRNGEVVLDLTEDVFYLSGPAEAVEEVDTGVRILADASDDYSKTQGQSGWYYGYTAAAGAFEEMRQKETMWGVDWAGPAPFLSLSRTSLHPGKIGGHGACAVLRWKSPVEGEVQLLGGVVSDNAGKGDGVEARVLVAGQPVFERHVGGPDAPAADFDVRVIVKKDAFVELAVGPGATTDFDATTFRFRVVQTRK